MTLGQMVLACSLSAFLGALGGWYAARQVPVAMDLDLAGTNVETLGCMTGMTKLAQNLGNDLNPALALSACKAVTVRRPLPESAIKADGQEM